MPMLLSPSPSETESPEASAHDKQPGTTRQDLLDRARTTPSSDDSTTPTNANLNGKPKAVPPPLPLAAPPPLSSSTAASAPTSPVSATPPVLPPTAVKRAASTATASSFVPPSSAPAPSSSAQAKGPSKSAPNTPKPPSRAASVISEAPSTATKESHKFTLKDLGPKLSRRSSGRSASSRHSADSVSDASVSVHSGKERDGGWAHIALGLSSKDKSAHGGSAKGKKDKGGKSGGSVKSTGGDSAASLSKKYGVCQKVAIGKGATSVVRLAHKWDRSEGDKMFAVKEFRKRRRTETEKEYVKKLTAEFCISSTLHHVNIVETVDLVQDEQGRWCEVMEPGDGDGVYFRRRVVSSWCTDRFRPAIRGDALPFLSTLHISRSSWTIDLVWPLHGSRVRSML
ncbi:hypothetical protein C8R47DRAFT_1231629 [Mycena vitilis]|nr:hypothetical protein C8R47DRAFT_1231629 [Mycena vitilis]